jgi:hypothetical protein
MVAVSTPQSTSTHSTKSASIAANISTPGLMRRSARPMASAAPR